MSIQSIAYFGALTNQKHFIMKWYWIPLLLVLALASSSLQAQFSIDSFDIATYKRPDLVRRTAFIDP